LKRFAFALFLALVPAVAAAQGDWPSRPVRFIVSQSTGGSIDIAARAIAQKLSAAMGQQFIIDNRAGANGMIALDAAAKAPADGYTLLVSSPGPLINNQFVYKSVSYDTLRDFVPVTQISSIAFLMAVNVNSPYKSVQDVVAAAKARPGEVKYASTGSGNQTHLAAEILAQASATKLLHIPYKGEAPAIGDLMGGQVDMIIGTMPALLAQVRAGRLRPIAVCQPQRSGAAPDVPTMAEAGYPAVEVTGWTGILAPAATPAAIVKRLHEGVAKTLAEPEMREFLAKQGAEPVGSTPEAFAAFIRTESVKWGTAAKAAGLKPE
jgi:tripartite-type tricarboxylate transporter receptor subunit TctC